MEFTNKTILIISPNFWGKMMVSKHHYALELAKKGNIVYYLNPPDLKKDYFEINKVADNLYLIDYKPIFRGQQYLPKFLFNFLVFIQVKFIELKVKKAIEVVWCFDNSIYLNLSYFKARYRILFIADKLGKACLLKIAKYADLIVSVSENLFEHLQQYNRRLLLVHHGLAGYFAHNQHMDETGQRDTIRAGFIGNLFKKALDRGVFRKIITDNPTVIFELFGAHIMAESNLSGFKSKESIDFVEYLKNQKNVVLKGVVEPERLSKELSRFDLFLFVENPQVDHNQSANSHKLIEYLSSGKVVVSNHVLSFKDRRDLIAMPNEMDNQNLPVLFKNVIQNLEYYNNSELQKKRIAFALDNTYEKQIQRIEEKLNTLGF
jgi:hypothetical protein